MTSLQTQILPPSQPPFQPQLALETRPLERPFAWKSEKYIISKQINFFSPGTSLTISFTATRSSKAWGYVPLLGTIIGVYRIYQGIQEYRYFNNVHFYSLSNRSLCWIARGALESIPVLGGIINIVIDIIATILSRNQPDKLPFPDDHSLCSTCKA